MQKDIEYIWLSIITFLNFFRLCPHVRVAFCKSPPPLRRRRPSLAIRVHIAIYMSQYFIKILSSLRYIIMMNLLFFLRIFAQYFFFAMSISVSSPSSLSGCNWLILTIDRVFSFFQRTRTYMIGVVSIFFMQCNLKFSERRDQIGKKYCLKQKFSNRLCSYFNKSMSIVFNFHFEQASW